MTSRTTIAASFVAALTFVASTVTAGPEWPEGNGGSGDAGSLPADAQVTNGVGPLQTISGQLAGEGLLGLGDFQDMYLINIVDPDAFFASTDPASGGFADFDTQLWLFDLSGVGILGNDDVSSVFSFSEFGNISDDGSGAAVTAPGLYYLAISGFDSDPLSTGGFIFDQIIPTEISGPDGPGGSLPISGWSGPGAVGSYEIALGGVEFVPAPASSALLLVMALRRRRRRA